MAFFIVLCSVIASVAGQSGAKAFPWPNSDLSCQKPKDNESARSIEGTIAYGTQIGTGTFRCTNPAAKNADVADPGLHTFTCDMSGFVTPVGSSGHSGVWGPSGSSGLTAPIDLIASAQSPKGSETPSKVKNVLVLYDGVLHCLPAKHHTYLVVDEQRSRKTTPEVSDSESAGTQGVIHGEQFVLDASSNLMTAWGHYIDHRGVQRYATLSGISVKEGALTTFAYEQIQFSLGGTIGEDGQTFELTAYNESQDDIVMNVIFSPSPLSVSG